MVVKVYISGISGNKEVKKRQQRVLMILDSKTIKYDVIDITEPGKEADKDFMQNNSTSNGGTVSDPNPRSALPPQLFNDDEYCGDYDQFDLANEIDTLEQFLKMEVPPEVSPLADNEQEKAVNGDVVEETNTESEKPDESTEAVDESGDKTEEAQKEGSPAKEGSPVKEAESAVSKEDETPAKDDADVAEGDAKEKSPEKESEERQKSVEKEDSPEVEEQAAEKEVEATLTEAKESSPEKDEVKENGSVSSREHSQEKEESADVTEVDRKKDDASDALIQSEQAAAAE